MAYREIDDTHGRQWRVWDTYPQSGKEGSYSTEYAGGWLTFECEAEKRRLIPVPSGWDEQPSTELLLLLTRAVPVQRRR